ncbi:MAG: hypothetical protein LBD75_07275 [Candidatus Peribacteria bacterium]|jgi:hypothetical protein|nr:hypothetical protein [Candidatus Peribacteria bacterium]
MGEFVYLTKRGTGKIALHLAHVASYGIDFMIACVDFSEKSATSTFSVTTNVQGYLRSTCGSTPGCDAGYYSVIGGETGDGCGILKKERATVCVKGGNTNKNVGGTCISSVVSNGSLTSGYVGFKITKGTVDQYGRCISNGQTATSTQLNARIDNNRDKNQSLGSLSV